MNKKLLIFFICVLPFFSCQYSNSKENRLRQRVNSYHNHMIKGEYASSWNFLWHDARRRHSKDDWVLFCERADSETKLIDYQIKSISIMRVKKRTYLAKIKLFGKHKLIKLDKIEKIEGEDEWVYENDDWFRYID